MYRKELPLLRRLLVAGSLALAACEAGDTTGPAAPGGPEFVCVGCPVVSSHILFSTLVGYQNSDIYATNPDGTGRRAIFTSQMDDYDPSWSPNYSKFVFCRRKSGHMGGVYNGLWTVGWDGLGLFRVTTDSSDKSPSWSKTNRIAFHSTRETKASLKNEIFTINPDGTGLIRLTNNDVEDRDPAWSPDGTKIAFASGRGRSLGKTHIYVMNADGTGVKQLTFGGSWEDQPAWSPDGTQIAYHAYDGLYTMNADGSNVHTLVAAVDAGLGGAKMFFAGQPTWSPDGKTLTFVSDLSGKYRMQTMPLAGGVSVLLTPAGAQDQFPAWN